MGFFVDVCARYGRNVYIQYYNTRLSVAEFSSESLIGNTIARFVDYMGRLIITVDSVDIGYRGGVRMNLQSIRESCEIDGKFYFKLCVRESRK